MMIIDATRSFARVFLTRFELTDGYGDDGRSFHVIILLIKFN